MRSARVPSPLLAAAVVLALSVACKLGWPRAADPAPGAYTLPNATATSPEAQILFGHGIDVNRADVAALELLPGIGPALAARIVRHREQHGDFLTTDALRDVPGIGAKLLERIRPSVMVSH